MLHGIYQSFYIRSTVNTHKGKEPKTEMKDGHKQEKTASYLGRNLQLQF